MGDFLERDMYLPVKRYFEERGYTVRSEVLGVDAVAVRGEEMLLLEFKKGFSMPLLYQAIDRLKVSKRVYTVIPRPKRRGILNKIIYIVKKLELGLITVDMDVSKRTVEIIAEPVSAKTLDNKRSRKVLAEAVNRTFDGNSGGSVNVKLLTAFRERNIKIACMLYKHGQMSVKELKAYGCGKETSGILSRNFYGWFYAVTKGVYFLTDGGFEEIENSMFKQTVEFYLKDE